MIIVTKGQPITLYEGLVVLKSGSYEGTDLVPLGHASDMETVVLSLQAYLLEQSVV